MGGTAETSYEMTHEVLAICSYPKTDNTKIGAQTKEEWNSEFGRII